MSSVYFISVCSSQCTGLSIPYSRIFYSFWWDCLNFSDSSMLAAYFCMLILYPATLLNSFLSSNSFLVESLGLCVCMCVCMCVYINKSFYWQTVTVLLLPVWVGWLLFFFLIALSRTSSTMFSKWWGLLWWLSGKESTCQCRKHGCDLWSGKIPRAMEQLSLWATTIEPIHHHHWSPHALEPGLHGKRSHCSEKSMPHH